MQFFSLKYEILNLNCMKYIHNSYNPYNSFVFYLLVILFIQTLSLRSSYFVPFYLTIGQMFTWPNKYMNQFIIIIIIFSFLLQFRKHLKPGHFIRNAGVDNRMEWNEWCSLYPNGTFVRWWFAWFFPTLTMNFFLFHFFYLAIALWFIFHCYYGWICMEKPVPDLALAKPIWNIPFMSKNGSTILYHSVSFRSIVRAYSRSLLLS